MKQLYVVQVDKCKQYPAQAEQYLQAGRQFHLHSGGRGNGAQGGLYTKEQLNRILGRYPDGVAKAIPVAFGRLESQWDKADSELHFLSCLQAEGVDNWSGYEFAQERFREEGGGDSDE